MRTTTLLAAAIIFCTSCNDANKTDEAKRDSLSPTSNVSLAYTTKETPDWERGSSENIALAMSALKGFETNSIDNMRQYFADSVEFRGDYWEYKGTADTLMNEFKKFRSTYSNYSIRMEDYESVKSKTSGDEYVSLWYQETFTDSKGKTDSLFAMDDIKIVNGKIRSIDSKVRHYPASRPK